MGSKGTSSIIELGGKAWTLDHIGHAVYDIAAHRERFEHLLNAEVLDTEIVHSQKVEVQFLQVGDSVLELIAPLPGNTILQAFLDRRGEGLHHLCFRVADIRAELQRLSSLGAKLIDHSPRHGSRNTEIAFLHPKTTNGILIELCAPISPEHAQ